MNSHKVELPLEIKGIEASKLYVLGQEEEGANPKLVVPADKVAEFRLFVAASPSILGGKSKDLTFSITNPETGEKRTAKDVFVGPEK